MFWMIIVIAGLIVAAIGAYFWGRDVERKKHERQEMQNQINELGAQLAGQILALMDVGLETVKLMPGQLGVQVLELLL